jgi:DNA repair protein RadC
MGGIKTWEEGDRPREKFAQLGRKSLSNAELLAILIGSGHRDASALDLARHLLESFQHDLKRISRSSVAQLCRTKGLGPAKATHILAGFEIGKRASMQVNEDVKNISCSQDAYHLLRHKIFDLPHEEFHIILLNRSNAVIATHRISTGGISGTVVDTRIIFRTALEHAASSIILVHNHPSGKLKPSQADLNITRKISEAGKLMDIQVLDHLIISDQGYLSFADEGIL